jgi:hypothetical protein
MEMDTTMQWLLARTCDHGSNAHPHRRSALVAALTCLLAVASLSTGCVPTSDDDDEDDEPPVTSGDVGVADTSDTRAGDTDVGLDASAPECTSFSFSTTSAQPLDRIEIDVTPSRLTNVAVTAKYPTLDEEYAFPLRTYRPNEDGPPSFRVPPHPNGIDGGTLEIEVSGPKGACGKAVDVSVEPLPEAPGTLQKLVSQQRNLVERQIEWFGYSVDEVTKSIDVEQGRIDRSLPSNLQPLAIAQFITDHEKNPDSLTAIRRRIQNVDSKTLRFLNAVLAKAEDESPFDEELQSLDSGMDPSIEWTEATSNGSDPGSLADVDLKPKIEDVEDLHELLTSRKDFCRRMQETHRAKARDDAVVGLSCSAAEIIALAASDSALPFGDAYALFCSAYEMYTFIRKLIEQYQYVSQCTLLPETLQLGTKSSQVTMKEDKPEDVVKRLPQTSLRAETGTWSPDFKGFREYLAGLVAGKITGPLTDKAGEVIETTLSKNNVDGFVGKLAKKGWEDNILPQIDQLVQSPLMKKLAQIVGALKPKYGKYSWVLDQVEEPRWLTVEPPPQNRIEVNWNSGFTDWTPPSLEPLKAGPSPIELKTNRDKFGGLEAETTVRAYVQPIAVLLEPQYVCVHDANASNERVTFDYEVSHAHNPDLEWTDGRSLKTKTSAESGTFEYSIPSGDFESLDVRAESISETGARRPSLDPPPRASTATVLKEGGKIEIQQIGGCVESGTSYDLEAIGSVCQSGNANANIRWSLEGNGTLTDRSSKRKQGAVRATATAELPDSSSSGAEKLTVTAELLVDGNVSDTDTLTFYAKETCCRRQRNEFVSQGGVTCKIREDDRLECWGTRATTFVPEKDRAFQESLSDLLASKVHVVSNTKYTDLTSGSEGGICALAADGEMHCTWEGSSRGGYWSPPNDTFSNIDMGSFHACGVETSPASVSCWGRGSKPNGVGPNEKGYPDPDQAVVPSGYGDSTEVIQLSAGEFSTCALSSSCKTTCWGCAPAAKVSPIDGSGSYYDSACEVSDDTREVSPRPLIQPPQTLVQLAEEPTDPPRLRCGISYGGVVCWGRTDRTIEQNGQSVMREVLSGRYVDIDGPGRCAVSKSGAIDCWGDGKPTQAGSNYVAVDYPCAMREDGSTACLASDEATCNTCSVKQLKEYLDGL